MVLSVKVLTFGLCFYIFFFTPSHLNCSKSENPILLLFIPIFCLHLIVGIVLYSLCGSFTKVDVDSFKASLFLSYIHSNCKFYTIDGIHKIWEWNNSTLVKDPHREYKTWCQMWDLVSKDLGSMDIEAIDINAMDMTSCSLVIKIEYS